MKYRCKQCGVEIKFENPLNDFVCCPYCRNYMQPIPDNGKMLTITLDCGDDYIGDKVCGLCRYRKGNHCVIFNKTLAPVSANNNLGRRLRLPECLAACGGGK